MKYRVEKLDDGKMYISDVRETSEKLFRRNNVFFGVDYQQVMSMNKFLKSFFCPNRSKYLLNIERDGNKVQAKYVEVIEGYTKFSTDVFELVNVDEKTLKRLDKFISYFNKDRAEYLKRITKKVLRKCKKDDPFLQCAKYINESSHHPKRIKTLKENDAERLYSYMVDISRFKGTDLIKYVPMKRIQKYRKSLKSTILDLVVGIVTIPLIWRLSLVGVYDWATIILVSLIIYITVSVDKDDKYSLECKKAYFDRLLEDMAKEYQLDLQKVINKEYSSNCATPSFVDFITSDLEYNEQIIKSPTIKDLLENLGENYSNTLRRSELFRWDQVDKKKYMKILLDIEMAMYCCNTKNGLMKKDSISITKGTIFDRLRYLGWSSEEINSNCFVKEIMGAFDRISEHPYEGCEVELQTLVKLATQLVYKEPKDEKFYESLYDSIGYIEDAAKYKLAQATELEKLVLALESQKSPLTHEQRTDKELKIKPIQDN